MILMDGSFLEKYSSLLSKLFFKKIFNNSQNSIPRENHWSNECKGEYFTQQNILELLRNGGGQFTT